MSPTISNLIEGMKHFSITRCLPDSVYNQTVEKGQTCKIMVVGCCDSLVDPLLLMGAKEGEIFVHRTIAALVPPCEHSPHLQGTGAALEHGAKNLKVDHLIVLGHGCCGGISALLNTSFNPDENDSFIQSWMQIAASAKEKVLREHPDVSLMEKRHLCEKESVAISLKNLHTFPWIAERVHKGELCLHGWHFDRGVLSCYDEKQKTFDLMDLREEL